MDKQALHSAPRRSFIAAAASVGLALPAAGAAPVAAGEKTETLERGRTRVVGFADAEMDYQLMRQLGAVRYGGASVGECLALARRIDDAVPASWVAEFSAAAERAEQDAAARAQRGHTVSARDQYLVASNSYRAAEYYCGVLDPQHARLGLKSRACFLAAMREEGGAFEAFSLPFGDTPLPAYFVRSPRQGARPGKTLMIVSGYDGTLEETWLAYGRAALERGYHLMLFTGPGQMDTLRFHAGLAFIPEYERVAKVALDHVLSRPTTDPQRVALMGISFGGYFATRMAAHEPRIRALIANSPIVDLHAYMVSFAGFDPAQMPDAEDIRLADVDAIPADAIAPQKREMMRNLMVRLGQDSFKRTYQRLREFRVDDRALRAIGCPVLGLAGSGEGPEPLAQAEHFHRSVGGPATRHVFTDLEGADGHCQNANLAYSAAVSMDWLDEVFA